MLCALAVSVAAQRADGAAAGAGGPGVEVAGDDWKYEGYERVEIVDGGKSATSMRVKRRKAYVFKYRARLTLRNTGARAVKAVGWDVVFEEPGASKESKRYPVQIKQHVPPGQTQMLVKEIHIKPEESTGLIGGGTRRVVLTRVEYADGSVWRADNEKP